MPITSTCPWRIADSQAKSTIRHRQVRFITGSFFKAQINEFAVLCEARGSSLSLMRRNPMRAQKGFDVVATEAHYSS
jgi:hypothetical protein